MGQGYQADARLIEVRNSEEMGEFYPAFVVAQAQIGPAIKNRKNEFNNSEYADLAAVNQAFRAAFSEAGLAVLQFPFTRSGSIERSYREAVPVGNKTFQRPVYHEMKINEGDQELERTDVIPMMETVPVIYVVVRTRIVHTSGQWLEQDLEIPVVMGSNPAQEIGKVITYGQRYALRSIAGVATEDEDAAGVGDPYTAPASRELDHSPAITAKPDNRPPARSDRRQHQSPARPQGKAGRLDSACARLRAADNLVALRTVFESSYKELEASGTDQDLGELTKVKDEIKAKLQPEPEKVAQPAAEHEMEQPPARTPPAGANKINF